MPKTYILKRVFDFCLAFVGIILFLPFWVLFSLLIWMEARGPIFYNQVRVGRRKKIFKTLKFRTLYSENSEYMGSTRLGRLLRVTALDESLQFINILKGDMSFVGPRPLIPQEILAELEHSPRFLVRPGLTGLSQVLISKDTSVSEKFSYDVLYIKNQSFLLDLRLIIFSFLVSFKGKWEDKGDKIGFCRHIFKFL